MLSLIKHVLNNATVISQSFIKGFFFVSLFNICCYFYYILSPDTSVNVCVCVSMCISE